MPPVRRIAELLDQDPVVLNALHRTASHTGLDIPSEVFSVRPQVFGCLFVQWVGCVGLEKQELHNSQCAAVRHSTGTYLHANHNGVEIQHRFPILPQNIQTHVPI